MQFLLFAVFSCLFSMLAQGSPTANQRTLVSLRIEGEDKTIFEGLVLTRGHDITTSLGGTHHCDGTNNGANPTPDPTPNAALDDAAKLHHFDFDGAFFTEFDDFLISSIDGEANTDTKFWTILVNFQFIPVGGCQQEVHFNDEILFAFDGFSKAHILKLSGPVIAHKNTPVVFTVTDGSTGAPVAGASINGQISGLDGKVSVTFAKVGLNGVKAQKDDSVRSNQVEVVVLN